MNEIRQKRLEKRILRLVADLYHKELKDPNLGFATFTHCQLSNDGAFARVFVSVYEDEVGKEKTLKALMNARGFIRSRVAANVRMRNIPEITFALDRSLEKAEQINELIDQGRESDQPTSG